MVYALSVNLVLCALLAVSPAAGFPGMGRHLESRSPAPMMISDSESLAGRSSAEIDVYIRGLGARAVGAEPVPAPLKDWSTKLVHDAAHPYQAPGPNDQRGPCPALNTMANHGWLPRSGVATPAQIIKASEEALSMGHAAAIFVVYGCHLTMGNQVTNLLSIGGNTADTGPSPPGTNKGLDTHQLDTHQVDASGLAVTNAMFEGDASLSRGDLNLTGNNHVFNQDVFDATFDICAKYSATGEFDQACAIEARWQRWQQSQQANKDFIWPLPRAVTSYVEATFVSLFVDGRAPLGTGVTKTNGTTFFKDNKFPDDFWKHDGAYDFQEFLAPVGAMLQVHPVLPGKNDVNGTFVVDAELAFSFEKDPACAAYYSWVDVVVALYGKKPHKQLRAALKQNLDNLYTSLQYGTCKKRTPYGK